MFLFVFIFVSNLGFCTIVLVVVYSNKSFILAFPFSFCLFFDLLALNEFKGS